ncbi:MAG: class I SAM-dependent methyltransferase [Pseudomonadota bacterium]
MNHAVAPAVSAPRPSLQYLLLLGNALRDARYVHTTVTPATHARVNARADEWATSLNDIFGWSRPFHAALVTPALLELMQRGEILQPWKDGWRSTVRLSTLDGGYYFHSAYPTEQDDAVFFGPDTYRFVRALQSDLAQLPDWAPRRVVDIGCGAGPAAISLARRWPQAQVLALDINQAALHLSTVNAALAQTSNVVARYSDLLSAVEGDVDLIVANPPYLIDRAQRRYRHGGGELGAGLSLAIVQAALTRLNPGGWLMLYTGVAMPRGAAAPDSGTDPFRARVAPLLNDAGWRWTYREVDPDVFGEELDEPAYRDTERIAAVWLTAHKPLPAPTPITSQDN